MYLSCLPIHCTVTILFSHHKKWICLAIRGRICAKIMNVYAIYHFGFRPLVMKMVFYSIGHIFGNCTMFQDHIAPCSVYIDSIPSVIGYIGMADGNNAIRLCDIDTYLINE